MSQRDEAEEKRETELNQANRALGIIAGIARDCLYNFGAQTYIFHSDSDRDEFAAKFSAYAGSSTGIPASSYQILIGDKSAEIKLTKPEEINLKQVLEFAKSFPKTLTPAEKVKLNIGNEWQAPKSKPISAKEGRRVIAEIARNAGAHAGENLVILIRTSVDSVREAAVAKITANLAKIGLVVGEDLSFSRQGDSSTYSTEILNKDFASKIDNTAYIKIIHSNAIAA